MRLDSSVVAALVGFSACVGVSIVLERLAPRARLVDDGSDAPERKAQRDAVPLVGGTAILVACVLTWTVLVATGARAAPWNGTSEILPGFRLHYGWALGAAFVAYVVGLIDDLAPRGLTPAMKLCLQGLPATLVAASRLSIAPEDVFGASVLGCGTILAQNALNLFDHADGVAGSAALLGLVTVPLGFQGVLLGFLTRNVGLGSGGRARSYMGDSGAHFLGLLLLVHPLGLAGLLLPVADLVRVVQERIAQRCPPWIGDRRHLGHVLQALGLAPLQVALAVFLLGLAPFACALLWPGKGILAGLLLAYFELRLVALFATSRARA